MARLLIFDDRVRGVDLPRQPLVIGRSRRSDIPIRDQLLSRKHCAIFPSDAGYRLVDLKSSHGTFLNGARIDKVDLKVDDVIEIGNTVLVYLDAGAWNPGQDLERVRNPAKARALVERLRLQDERRRRIPTTAPRRRASRSRRLVLAQLTALFGAAASDSKDDGAVDEALLECLADFAVFKTLALGIRRQPSLKRLLIRAVDRALAPPPGSWEAFRARLKNELRALLPALRCRAPVAGPRSETAAVETGVEKPAAGPETQPAEPPAREAQA
jgi:pSer/pThr/pTyr-binding forkhead associated (FHA) protein